MLSFWVDIMLRQAFSTGGKLGLQSSGPYILSAGQDLSTVSAAFPPQQYPLWVVRPSLVQSSIPGGWASHPW